MYEINEMPPQVDRELLALLAQCRTESIGHYREWGCVHGSISAVMPERRVVGTAVTLAIPGHDSGLVTYVMNMIRPGDVICIDRLGDNHNSCWGGGTTLAAKVAGAEGVVIDGPSTGSSKFREFDLPAWIRGYSPITCHPYGNGGAIKRQAGYPAMHARLGAGEKMADISGLGPRIAAAAAAEDEARGREQG